MNASPDESDEPTMSDPAVDVLPSPVVETGPSVRQTLKDKTRRFVRIVSGLMLVIMGILAVPTPFPIGFVLSIVGLAVLAAEAEWIVTAIRWLRERIPAFSKFLDGIAPRMPDYVKEFIDDSRPY